LYNIDFGSYGNNMTVSNRADLCNFDSGDKLEIFESNRDNVAVLLYYDGVQPTTVTELA